MPIKDILRKISLFAHLWQILIKPSLNWFKMSRDIRSINRKHGIQELIPGSLISSPPFSNEKHVQTGFSRLPILKTPASCRLLWKHLIPSWSYTSCKETHVHRKKQTVVYRRTIMLGESLSVNITSFLRHIYKISTLLRWRSVARIGNEICNISVVWSYHVIRRWARFRVKKDFHVTFSAHGRSASQAPQRVRYTYCIRRTIRACQLRYTIICATIAELSQKPHKIPFRRLCTPIVSVGNHYSFLFL